MEEFRPVMGYEDLYEVSNTGKVRSLSRPQELKPEKSNAGYLRVHLRKGGTGRKYSIHRLVATAFVPNLESKPCVNHLDSNRVNNDASNLEWATHSENSQHMVAQGRESRVRPPSAKFNDEQIRNIREMYAQGIYQRVIAKQFGVPRPTITHIVNFDIYKSVNAKEDS